jgi:ABC-type Na+ efflux pump permease subunit
VRFNVLGYFLLAAMTALVPDAIELLAQPNAFFHANGYVVIVFAIALLAWPLMSSFRNANSART